MKKSLIALVGWFLIVSAFAFYIYGMYEAIQLSWGKGPVTGVYNDVLSATVGSLQALLLTNLGMLLGISVANPTSAVAMHLMLNRPKLNAPISITPPLELKEKVQLAALVIFVLSLIICLVTWIIDDFSSDSKDIISIVSSSGKMFVGVVLAYLTALLK